MYTYLDQKKNVSHEWGMGGGGVMTDVYVQHTLFLENTCISKIACKIKFKCDSHYKGNCCQIRPF